jgi:hypothetical protein
MAKSKLTQQQLELRDVMQIQSGRAFVSRMLDDLGYFTDTFNEDPIMHAKLAGARSSACTLVTEIEALLPELWMKLLRERLDKKQNNNQPENTDNDDSNNDDPN